MVLDPTDSGHLRQSFSSLAVPVFPGVAGRRISLARGADDPGSPADPALASAKGMPLGLGAATAPLDGTDCASIPLCGKGGGAHIHTHTPAHRERAATTSACHSRHALASGARTCGIVLCVGM